MPTWNIKTPRIGAQPIADRSTTAKHQLGEIVQAEDIGSSAFGSGEFIYVKGVSSATKYEFAGINADDGTVTRAIANGIYPVVGTLQSTLTASYYGWAQITGKAIGKVLTGYLDNAKVYLTGTAGAVDDTSVAGDLVVNAKGASAAGGPGTLLAEFELARPWTNDAMP